MPTTLADPAEFAAVIGITYVPGDPVNTLLLEAASDIARRYCHRNFDLTIAEAITMDGTGTRDLIMPDAPVLGVTALSTTDPDQDPVVLDPLVDIRISSNSGILHRVDGSCWPRGYGNIAVTYTHGFTEVPPDLQMAVIQIGARLHATSGGQGLVEQEGIATYSVTYATTDQQQQGPELATLDRYRLAQHG
jgi:hypothetical protein